MEKCPIINVVERMWKREVRQQECVKNWCQTEYGVEYDKVISEILSKMSNTGIYR